MQEIAIGHLNDPTASGLTDLIDHMVPLVEKLGPIGMIVVAACWLLWSGKVNLRQMTDRSVTSFEGLTDTLLMIKDTAKLEGDKLRLEMRQLSLEVRSTLEAFHVRLNDVEEMQSIDELGEPETESEPEADPG